MEDDNEAKFSSLPEGDLTLITATIRNIPIMFYDSGNVSQKLVFDREKYFLALEESVENLHFVFACYSEICFNQLSNSLKNSLKFNNETLVGLINVEHFRYSFDRHAL